MRVKLVHLLFSCLLFSCLLLTSTAVHSHGTDIYSPHKLDWHSEQIKSVFSSSPFNDVENHPKTEKILNKICMTGPFLNVDVLDSYAHDLDEEVKISLEFDLENSEGEVVLRYDKNGGGSNVKRITLPEKHSGRWYQHTFTLERARFAGRIIRHTNLSGDFAIMAGSRSLKKPITLCNIVITRDYKTQKTKALGNLALSLFDDGEPVPATVGIYDSTDRAPLPESEAVAVNYKSLMSRNIVIPKVISWPVENRNAFYIDGTYHAKLPAGKYQIVIARGPEYRITRESFEIVQGKETQLEIGLHRWIDMPEKGWYSGDVHIHYGRSNKLEDKSIRLQMQAEDLHVANLLQMDDIATVDFHQYNWGKDAYENQSQYALVPGQEGPRSHRGHTIQLNIRQPIQNAARYYLYHETFEAIHQQGGIIGYAHTRRQNDFGASYGLALDAPFGLVDFVEVLQFAKLDLEVWFDFLNLGYKLSPAAGSDSSPLTAGTSPGDVRSYVKVDGKYSVQKWFGGLRSGKTFATTGPMLTLTVNGKGMGSDVHVSQGETLSITTSGALNPDIGLLEKIELYQQGELIAYSTSEEGSQELMLNRELYASQGGWFVVKAIGKKNKNTLRPVAVSAPVYVYVDGNGFCKLPDVPSIVEKQNANIQKLLHAIPENHVYSYDFPLSLALRNKHWPKNLPHLKTRVEQANLKYKHLLSLASKGRCIDGNDKK